MLFADYFAQIFVGTPLIFWCFWFWMSVRNAAVIWCAIYVADLCVLKFDERRLLGVKQPSLLGMSNRTTHRKYTKNVPWHVVVCLEEKSDADGPVESGISRHRWFTTVDSVDSLALTCPDIKSSTTKTTYPFHSLNHAWVLYRIHFNII